MFMQINCCYYYYYDYYYYYTHLYPRLCCSFGQRAFCTEPLDSVTVTEWELLTPRL